MTGRDASALRKGAVAAAVLALSVSASPAATGLEDYQAGNFDKAKAEFERRLQAAPESEKLHFNAGAASYKLGDFAKAVDHFTKALLSDDQRLRERRVLQPCQFSGASRRGGQGK